MQHMPFARTSRTRRIRNIGAACALALAACGGEAIAGGDEEITLTVWDWSYDTSTPFGTALQQLDDAYMDAHPNVTIDHVQYPYDDYFTLIKSAITAKEGPDVFGMYGASFGADFSRGLLPLDDLVTDEQRDQLLFFDDIAVGGRTLVVPWTTFASRLQFNKSLYSDAGLDPETPPATWDDFLAACDALNEAGTIPLAAGFKDGYYGEWLMYALSAQTLDAEQLALQYRREMPWTEPGFKQALDAMVELEQRGCLTPSSQSFDSANPTTEFVAGDAAAAVAQESDSTEIAGEIGAENLGIMRFPVLPDSLYSEPFLNATYNLGLSIGTWSDQQDAAWDYISYMVSPEAQQVAFEVGGYLPNNTETVVTSELESFDKLLDWIRNDPQVHFGVQFSSEEAAAFDARIGQVISGDITSDQLIEELETVRVRLGPVEVEG